MYDTITSVTARNALSRLSEMAASKAADTTAPVTQTSASSFGDVLSQVTDTVSNRLQTAEANSIGAIKGETPVQEVVSSVMQAEQALQTTIAIRDKIVQAYLEISRMPI